MQNLPNGLPPQQFKPQVPSYNGVHSSHSSRDSSPAARLNQIPSTQLPPSLTQNFQQLNVSNFGTSTPLGPQQRPSFPPSNTCSPVQNFQQGFANSEQQNKGAGVGENSVKQNQISGEISTSYSSSGQQNQVGQALTNVPTSYPSSAKQNQAAGSVGQTSMNYPSSAQQNQVGQAATNVPTSYPSSAQQKQVASAVGQTSMNYSSSAQQNQIGQPSANVPTNYASKQAGQVLTNVPSSYPSSVQQNQVGQSLANVSTGYPSSAKQNQVTSVVGQSSMIYSSSAQQNPIGRALDNVPMNYPSSAQQKQTGPVLSNIPTSYSSSGQQNQTGQTLTNIPTSYSNSPQLNPIGRALDNVPTRYQSSAEQNQIGQALTNIPSNYPSPAQQNQALTNAPTSYPTSPQQNLIGRTLDNVPTSYPSSVKQNQVAGTVGQVSTSYSGSMQQNQVGQALTNAPTSYLSSAPGNYLNSVQQNKNATSVGQVPTSYSTPVQQNQIGRSLTNKNAGLSSGQQNFAPNFTQQPSQSYNFPPTSQQFSNVPLTQQLPNNVPVSQQNLLYQQNKTNLHSNRYPNAAPQNIQQPYNGQQQYSVPRQGFNKLWGTENYDLLQIPNILPPTKIEPPRISLGQEYLDAANCSPDVFRCTLTKIPETNNLLQKSRLPLGILIHPFKDLNHLPVIQCNVIVRCRACRTYINPFVFFVDSKRWKCNLCYRVNELPEEFQYDPVSKTYGDPSRRPEIKASTIEYIAPAEYMLRPPQPAVYLFLLDISRLAIESGYLETFCQVLTSELPNLPGDSRTQIGFIAYDAALHFFSLNDGLSRPHEMIIVETDETFLPCPDNLLVNLKDKMELVMDLLSQLPTRYNNSYDNSSALGAALQTAHKLMASVGGRITVFQASLPNIGPGALTPREDPSQRAASEAQHLNPAIDFYKRLALECSSQQIAVDLFIINSQYVDVATISGISRFSGGCMYHFPLFKASRVLQNEAFERSLKRYLIRKIGFEAVMRIRCTRGLSIHTFHGNFFVRSTDLLSLPNINPDAGFGMQIAIEESLADVQTVCFQAALLYTSSKGERRIRVHTLCVPTAATLPEILNSADQQCIIGLLAKMAVDRSMQSSLSDAREALVNVAIDVLSSYKMSLNLGTTMSGLLVPHCFKLLPLYISALLKCTAFRTGTSTRLDDRVKAMCDMKTKPLYQLLQMVYPDLYAVHNLEEQPTNLNEEEEAVPLAPHLQLTARNIDSNGAYLLDTGESMVLMVCPTVSSVFLNQALGVPDYNSITDDMYELPLLDNPHNHRLNCFINYLNDDKPFQATLHIIRENSSNRNVFYERLIEDRVESALSYHEFLQHLKTQVK